MLWVSEKGQYASIVKGGRVSDAAKSAVSKFFSQSDPRTPNRSQIIEEILLDYQHTQRQETSKMNTQHPSSAASSSSSSSSAAGFPRDQDAASVSSLDMEDQGSDCVVDVYHLVDSSAFSSDNLNSLPQ